MKQEILDYIKEYGLTPEEDEFDLDVTYKNHDIFFRCNPRRCVVELDVFDTLTETLLQFTHKEIDDLIEHFDSELQEYYYNQDMLRDQLNHESDLWSHR